MSGVLILSIALLTLVVLGIVLTVTAAAGRGKGKQDRAVELLAAICFTLLTVVTIVVWGPLGTRTYLENVYFLAPGLPGVLLILFLPLPVWWFLVARVAKALAAKKPDFLESNWLP